MKAEELKGVLESLYGGRWRIIDTAGGYTAITNDQQIVICLQEHYFFIQVPYIYIRQQGMSSKEYRELVAGFTLISGYLSTFKFDESMVTKLGPILRDRK